MSEDLGKLYIFTSYTPGAGKSYRMMETACADSDNVYTAFLNSAHRDMAKLLVDNDVKMRDFSEYSMNELLLEKPDIVVLDEMGMITRNTDKIRNRKNTHIYNDIDRLLEAGINVYTSVNLKRFESANPLFKEITGIGIKKKIPDVYLEKAYKIYFVDRDKEKMIEDFQKGELFVDKYMNSRIMQKNFLPETLEKYREVSFEFLKQYSDKVEIVKRNDEK